MMVATAVYVESSSQHNAEDDAMEVDCTQTSKSQKSQKELSKDELNRKVHLLLL